MTNSLLPPNSTVLERALEHGVARLSDVPAPVEAPWNPATCPADLLPWLAWGLSVDLWDPAWPVETKRDAIADAIDEHRRKGTPASLRAVLDRIDPLIGLVEWFDDPDDMLAPHTFRLELPTMLESDVIYSEALVRRILRDIASVKPVRSHMFAIHRLTLRANAWLLSGATLAGFVRLEAAADATSALHSIWSTYLLSQDGEPLQDDDGTFLEFAL